MKMEQQHGRVFLTRLLESPGYVDPNTLSLKTWQISLVDPTGSDMCSEELPKSGSMLNGKLYERVTLGHSTKDPESGLWPTPTAATNGPGKDMNNPRGKHQGNALATAVSNPKYWPTPSAADNRDRGHMDNPAIKRRVEKGKQVMLSMAVKPHKMTGALNPDWVEWLMGFPIGHSDIEVDNPGPLHSIDIEPDIPRVTAKSKNRANKLKCLGNALVPQIAELIGEMIINDNDTQTRKAQEEVKAPEKAR